jgi:hypothetical protein
VSSEPLSQATDAAFQEHGADASMLAVVARLTQDGFESQSDGERELRLPPPLQSPPRSTPRATTILTSKLKPPGPFNRVLGSSAYASGVGERPKPKGSQVSFADDSAFKPRRARSDTPATPFPSSSPRRADDEATPRVLAAAFALESIAERLKTRCVLSFPRVSPCLPPSHSCAPFSPTLALPPPRRSPRGSKSKPAPARTNDENRTPDTVPPASKPKQKPAPNPPSLPAASPLRATPSRQLQNRRRPFSRRALDETSSEATVASAKPSLVDKRAPAKRAKLAPARAPASASAPAGEKASKGRPSARVAVVSKDSGTSSKRARALGTSNRMSDDALDALRVTDLTAWKRVVGNRKSAAMSKARKAAELADKTEECETLGRLLEKARRENERLAEALAAATRRRR